MSFYLISFLKLLFNSAYMYFGLWYFKSIYESNPSISSLPMWIVISVIIGISILNFKWQDSLDVLGGAVLTIGMYFFYLEAVKNNYDILQSDLFFIKIIKALIFLSVFVILTKWLKKFFLYYFKAAQLYSVANPSAGILTCFFKAGVLFKYTASIPVFNSIIRNSINDISELAKSKITQQSSSDNNEMVEETAVDPSQETTNDLNNTFTSVLHNVMDTPLFKLPKYVFKVFIDYIDECVLAYCYEYPKKGLIKGTGEAIFILFKNCYKLIPAILTTSILQILIRIAIFVIVLLYYFKCVPINIMTTISTFIIYKCISFVIEDSIIEPLLMRNIVKVFIANTKKLDVTEEEVSSVYSVIPSLNKIKTLNGGYNE